MNIHDYSNYASSSSHSSGQQIGMRGPPLSENMHSSNSRAYAASVSFGDTNSIPSIAPPIQKTSYKITQAAFERKNLFLEKHGVRPNIDNLFKQRGCTYTEEEITKQETLRRIYNIADEEDDDDEDEDEDAESAQQNDIAKQKRIQAHRMAVIGKQKVILFSVITTDDEMNSDSDSDHSEYDFENQPEDPSGTRLSVVSL